MVFEERPDVFIAGVGGNKPVAREDAAGVGVDDEDFALEGVEEDGVGGLGADAVDLEELPAEGGGAGSAERPNNAVGEPGMEPVEEAAEAAGLDVEVSHGPDEAAEEGVGAGSEAVRVHEVGALEPGDGAFDVGPTRVLGEDGADHDLERRVPGPPALGAEGLEEAIIDGQEPSGVRTLL